jgi:drug/metabolite transporter (DMT)-like permease
MPHSGNLRSIVAMLAAVGFFSLMDTVLKLLSAHYPALQVAALRGLTALPLVLLYVAWRREAHTLFKIRWRLHLLRGVIGVLMLSLFTFALRELPLAEAYTIFFVAPLLITVLSIPVLKERVRPAHWGAIAVGMVGVVIALRPQGEGFFTWGALAVLTAALCYSVSAICGRLLSRTDSAVSLVFWSMAMIAVGAGVLAAPGWVPVRAEHTALLLALAATGFVAQLCITEAFRHGQAAAVAPFEYTALAWGAGIDWLIWHTLPQAHTLLGAAVVIASGLYLIHLERGQNTALPP